jgi:hypothetical protein
MMLLLEALEAEGESDEIALPARVVIDFDTIPSVAGRGDNDNDNGDRVGCDSTIGTILRSSSQLLAGAKRGVIDDCQANDDAIPDVIPTATKEK